MGWVRVRAMSVGADCGSRGPGGTPAPRELVLPVLWWSRDFAGTAEQVGEARHWIARLLPECDPLADVLLLAGELCANAVVHTRSGQADGWFSVDVELTPALVRVVVGDQGSALAPAASAIAADDHDHDHGRGLWLVEALADDWGTARHPAGRVVWADVRWRAEEATAGEPEKGNAMVALRCSCGFTELGDEEIIDHLHEVFESWDLRGNDGQVHQETDLRTCACGLVAITSEELDAHLLKAFTPVDAIAPDGMEHRVIQDS